MELNRLFISALLLVPAAAAARPSAYLDVFYVPWAESKVSDPVFLEKGDGDGYGIRLRVTPMPRFFVQSEWQRNTYESDNTDIEGTALRLGVGAPFFVRKRLNAYGFLEGLRVEFNDRRSDEPVIEEDGLGLHVGVLFKPLDALGVHVQAGMLELEDSDGEEFQMGAAMKLDPRVGLFVDYRLSRVESIRNIGAPERVDYEFAELRGGVRFWFGRPER